MTQQAINAIECDVVARFYRLLYALSISLFVSLSNGKKDVLAKNSNDSQMNRFI